MAAVHNSRRVCRLRAGKMPLVLLMLALFVTCGGFAEQTKQNGSNARKSPETDAIAPTMAAGATQAALDPSADTTILDRVVAVVEGSPILASDVDEEMRFAALEPENEPAADNTPQKALQRLIDRTLVDRQRALQPGLAGIRQQQVDREIADLKKGIPSCAQYNCATQAGWLTFLKAHHLTQQEVEDRIRERLAVLKFIDMRFGVAIRVPNADVQKYYDQVFKPELLRDHAAVPEFKTVASRIREILRQQQVTAMVDQWLKSLEREGHVRILDPAYGNAGSGL